MARVASPSLPQKRKTCVCVGEGSLASPIPFSLKTNVCVYGKDQTKDEKG